MILIGGRRSLNCVLRRRADSALRPSRGPLRFPVAPGRLHAAARRSRWRPRAQPLGRDIMMIGLTERARPERPGSPPGEERSAWACN
jgi:hypothetical protein